MPKSSVEFNKTTPVIINKTDRKHNDEAKQKSITQEVNKRSEEIFEIFLGIVSSKNRAKFLSIELFACAFANKLNREEILKKKSCCLVEDRDFDFDFDFH